MEGLCGLPQSLDPYTGDIEDFRRKHKETQRGAETEKDSGKPKKPKSVQ
jgi:hypothetical protein